MRIKPQIDRTTILLVGSFNPAVFQPAWFARHGMIGDEEAEDPNMSVNGRESRFKTAQFRTSVRRDRFMAAGLDNHSDPVRDLAVSCFKEALPHTPIHTVRISRRIRFDAGSSGVRDGVVGRLAPKEAWGEWMEQASRESGNGSERGDISSIVMTRDLESEEGLKIRVDARVGPSIRTRAGIFVNVVSHFPPDDGEEEDQDASFAVGILQDCWESSLERAEFIFDQIMKLAEECAE